MQNIYKINRNTKRKIFIALTQMQNNAGTSVHSK